MTWGAVGGAVAGAVVTSYGANKAAKTANQGVEAQIAAEREARAAGMEASKFRPVGFTSPYGTANYQVDAEGNLISAGFNLSDEMQNRAGTFGRLGQDVLSQLSIDPMQVAQERTNRLTALLDPQRSLQTEQTFANLAAKGLTGVGADLGTGQNVNPMMAGLQSNFAQQDLGIAAESLDFAQQDILNRLNLARGLFSDQSGVFDIGRSELDYGFNLADRERQRRLEGAGMAATSAQNIGNLTSQIAGNNAQMQAAMYGQFGGIANKAVQGLMRPTTPQQPQDTGFRFYNAPAPQQQGYPDTMLSQRWT